MTYYDVAMAVVVIAGMIWGAWRGITWQLASLASLVLGYTVAQPLSVQLAPKFPGEPVVARALAMLTIYVAVSCGVFMVAWAIRATLRALQFEAFDRHLGMVLGGLEGAFLGLVVTFFVASLAPQTRGPIFSSPSGRVVGQVMVALGPVLPAEARTELARFWNDSADDDAPEPKSKPEPESRSRSESKEVVSSKPGRLFGGSKSRDDSVSSTSLQDVIEAQGAKIGRAVVETAEKELEAAGIGGTNGRPTERR